MSEPLDLEAIKKRAEEHKARYPWRYAENAKDFLPRDRVALVAEVERLRAKAALVDEMRELAQRHILSGVFADVLFDVTDDQPGGSQTEGADRG